MLRASRFLALAFILSALSGVLVGPVGAVNTLKVQLEAGSHELVVGGERLVIETSQPLVVKLQAHDGFIRGVMEAASQAESSQVRIILLGPPDQVIFDGVVGAEVDFDSSNADETGHSEL